MPKSSLNSDPLSSFSLTLMGPFGSRKTTTMIELFGDLPPKLIEGVETPQKLYIYNFDMKLNGPIEQVKKKIPNLEVLYDDPFVDDEGKEVSEAGGARYQLFKARILKIVKDPTIGAIALDSTSTMVDVMMPAVLERVKPKNGRFDLQCFGVLSQTFTKIICNLKACGKPIIFLSHENLATNDEGQVVAYEIAIPGSTKTKIGTLSTDVWRSEVNGDAHKIRVSSSHRYNLTNSLGLIGEHPAEVVKKAWREKYLKPKR